MIDFAHTSWRWMMLLFIAQVVLIFIGVGLTWRYRGANEDRGSAALMTSSLLLAGSITLFGGGTWLLLTGLPQPLVFWLSSLSHRLEFATELAITMTGVVVMSFGFFNAQEVRGQKGYEFLLIEVLGATIAAFGFSLIYFTYVPT